MDQPLWHTLLCSGITSKARNLRNPELGELGIMGLVNLLILQVRIQRGEVLSESMRMQRVLKQVLSF